MAEILPTPRAGTWFETDPTSGPWEEDPRAGTWFETDLFDGDWEPQQRAGTWFVANPATTEIESSAVGQLRASGLVNGFHWEE